MSVVKSFLAKLKGQSYLVTLFLRAVATGLLVSESQYVYQRVALSYTDDLSSLGNTTTSCGASEVNASSENNEMEAKISAETSRWSMYMSICGGLPTILVILLLGSYSDQVGRRFLFVVSLSGVVIKSVILTLVIYFKLHLGFLLLAEFMEGVAGGYAGLVIASFSYTADQHSVGKADQSNTGVYAKGSRKDLHPAVNGADNHSFEHTETEGETGRDVEMKTCDEEHEKVEGNNSKPTYDGNRAVRILAIECFNVSSMGIVQLILGYFIKLGGFFYVSLTATLILIVDLIYTWIVIKNAETQVKKRKSILAPLKIVVKAIRQPRKLSAFILCNLAIMLIVFGDGGLIRTMPIYQMSPPFCWSSVEIGWFNSEFYFVTLWSVPFLMVLKKTGLSEPTMAGIGTTINAIGTAIYALGSVHSWIFFIVAVLTVPGMLAYAFTRTITSRLAGPEAHGAMFAFTSMVEQTMWLVGSVTGSGIYQVTVAKLHNAVFIYFASIYFLAALVYYLEGFIERRMSPYAGDEERSVDVSSETTGPVATEENSKAT